MSIVWCIWLFAAILTVMPIMVILRGCLQEELQCGESWQQGRSLKGAGHMPTAFQVAARRPVQVSSGAYIQYVSSEPSRQQRCSLKGAGHTWIVAGAMAVFSVSSLLLYHKLGAAQLLADYYTSDKIAHREQLKIMQGLVAKLNRQELKLKITLQVKPDDPAAWRELAVIHSVKQDNLAAECAMQQAVNSAINHDGGDLLLNYAACLLRK